MNFNSSHSFYHALEELDFSNINLKTVIRSISFGYFVSASNTMITNYAITNLVVSSIFARNILKIWAGAPMVKLVSDHTNLIRSCL